MQSFKVEHSSTIEGARYEPETREMQIDFKTSVPGKFSTYSYQGVSIETWEKFSTAPSKGKHFSESIRKQFPGKKL
jgi:hypothetical protein